MKKINNSPLILTEDFYDSIESLPLDDFPLIEDFYIHIYKTDLFGYHLDYRSKKYGQLSIFPWWDNIENEIRSENNIPIGTIEHPYDDLEQGWQIYIFKRRSHVYILEGEEPCCKEFLNWYKVERDQYFERWNETINTLMKIRNDS